MTDREKALAYFRHREAQIPMPGARAMYQEAIKALEQPDLTHIIFETLAECGIYGEEATVKLIGTLKRLGRNDLLPPCVR